LALLLIASVSAFSAINFICKYEKYKIKCLSKGGKDVAKWAPQLAWALFNGIKHSALSARSEGKSCEIMLFAALSVDFN